MRIRTIKPEFWSSEDLAALDYFDRLVFIGLWSMADDEGRLQGDARLIRSQLFPIDDHIGESSVRTHGALTEDSLSIHDTLMHLSNGGQITLYEGCNGRTYIQVTNFTEHQRINRPTASKDPAPTRENTMTHGALTEDSVRTHGALTEDSSLEQGTGNREQGTGVPSLRSGVQGGDDSDAARVDRTPATVVADAPTQTTKAKRGTRLPEGWTPERSQANLKAEHDSSLTPDELSSQLERFRDHWAAQPGSKGTKLDWQATWRNWVRRAAEMAPRTRQSETDAWYARAKARASNPNPLLSLLVDDARPSDDPGRHAMPPRSA